MAAAWLDSLSEDWISQPGSDYSDPQLPPLPDAPDSQKKPSPSRIPLRVGGDNSSLNILSERSANDNNISRQRFPSKLNQEVKANRDTSGERSASTSTDGSVVHKTNEHNTSPKRSETPEWKRRLVHGNVHYGEQRDLFSSAAEGLKGMFRPPAEPSMMKGGSQNFTVASSPPEWPPEEVSVEDEHRLHTLGEEDEEDEGAAEVTPSPSPRKVQRDVKYKLNDSFRSSFGSIPDDTPSRQTHQQDHAATDQPSVADETRQASGHSETRINEDFSPILIGKHGGPDGAVAFAPIELPVDKLKQRLENLRINQALLASNVNIEEVCGGDNQHDEREIENTEQYGQQGGFLNMRRGGRSADGSFRQRPLSVELGVDSSEMLPEESGLQASTPKHFPTMSTRFSSRPLPSERSLSPSLPLAPFPSPDKKQQPMGATRQNGSPLKLFGPYDTFTNQTLLRRISQFEDGTSSSGSRATSGPQRPGALSTTSRKTSRFGEGELEGFEFQARPVSPPSDDSYFSNKENMIPPSPPFSKLSTPGKGDSPLSDTKPVVRRRHKSESSTSSRHTRVASQTELYRNPYSPAREAASSPGGIAECDNSPSEKRPRTSPSKDPTPKRRRTLHRSDIAFGREQQLTALARLSPPGSPGKGGFTALQNARPEVLATRVIIRPRSLTPQQASSADGDSALSAQHGPRVTKTGPGDPSNYQDRPLSGSRDTARKPSLQTQDFVDQAAQIMAMIRNQVRPNGLASVEESADEASSPGGNTYESSTEPLDRPPSRGGGGWRVPQGHQEDAEVVSKLRKYQELSDTGDVVSGSLRSHGATSKPRRENHQEEHDPVHQHLPSDLPMSTDGGEIQSDIPNVRISTNPASLRTSGSPKRNFNSTSSTGGTNQNYPSASSRGSDSCKIIMPQSVSHLIPNRVGSMQLDHDHNVWIKQREPSAEHQPVPDEDSEGDPFASIPDLTVDMAKEMQSLRLTTAKKEFFAYNPDLIESPESPTRKSKSHGGLVTLTPNNLKSSQIAPLAKEEIAKFEKSISDDDKSSEGGEQAPHHAGYKAKRNVTIAFSSPLASVIRDKYDEGLDDLAEELQNWDVASSSQSSPAKSPKPRARKSALKAGQAQSSRRDADFVPRPVSRIEEQNEDSTVELPYDDQRQLSIIGDTSLAGRTPNHRQTSLSFVINQTPAGNALALHDDSGMIGQNVGKLSLSPLSEFTIHHPEQSYALEVSYVMDQRHLITGDGSKKVLSMTIRDLVDRLAEAEPLESYWEDITRLDLSEKRLTSLHMLDEFCGKIVALDASQNALGHLDGVPSSVRELRATQNLLTELTNWDHLTNLQYVDISGNGLTSLSGLKNLVHLRSIKADGNQLRSLDGLDSHDGLLNVSVRNNCIQDVDFEQTKLPRVTDLDLTGNRISNIRSLACLPNITKLRLAKNRLAHFIPDQTVQTLRVLDLNDNVLSSLDLKDFPSLHSLHADRNRLASIKGLTAARRLDSLSLREQYNDQSLDLGFMSSGLEIRKLFLSGNKITNFKPAVDLLNLQLLEMANCGLDSLPPDLGQLMPNLRTLNLNFNALSDLNPLRFVPRLKKLLAAGNRLTDSPSIINLITDFPHLAQLDLRDNPITLGFYQASQHLVSLKERSFDPFNLPEADQERDEAFAKRLDKKTAMYRRLHEVVFVASCPKLRLLDGLRVRRSTTLRKDEMLEALISSGVLPDWDREASIVGSPGDRTREEVELNRVDDEGAKVRDESTRWPAEDTFA